MNIGPVDAEKSCQIASKTRTKQDLRKMHLKFPDFKNNVKLIINRRYNHL